MKKVLVTICAMVAVLACTKTEVCFDDPSEIAFTPVSKFETKAAVTGEYYSATQNFYAWAYIHSENTPYFAEVLFKPEEDQGDDVPANLTSYVGYPSQYWPNVKALDFAGVTVSGNVAESNVEGTASSITITNYDQPLPADDATASNDLMWFFDNTGYTDQDSYVQPTMKHACSWIVVNVALDADLVNYWDDVKVNSIKFETLNTVGTPTMTSTGVTWASVGTPETNVEIYTGTTEIDATPKTLATVADNTIVIPQAPTTLAVNFTYTTPASGSVTETITGVELDYDGNNAWVAGTKYTYTLTIGADEIKIAPDSEDWSAYDADSSTTNVADPIKKDVK